MAAEKPNPLTWIPLLLVAAYWFYTLGVAPQTNPPPIPGEGLRVLVVEDILERPTLPLSQQVVFTSQKVQEYLSSHCAKSSDGSPGFRFLLEGTNMADAPKEWQEAMARPRKELPWVVISNGKSGTEGPLPKSEEAMLAELQKWGGP